MRIYLVLILAVVFASCVRNKSGQVVQNVETTNEKSFEVVEVVQANSYSYLRVKENFNEKSYFKYVKKYLQYVPYAYLIF